MMKTKRIHQSERSICAGGGFLQGGYYCRVGRSASVCTVCKCVASQCVQVLSLQASVPCKLERLFLVHQTRDPISEMISNSDTIFSHHFACSLFRQNIPTFFSFYIFQHFCTHPPPPCAPPTIFETTRNESVKI